MAENRKVRFINQVAYGIGDIYGGGSFFLISTFSMFFFINVAGLSPVLAGLIPGLGKIWDAVSDPWMGYITDNTKSRFGRRRVYFLAAIIPIVISSALIWLPVRFDNQLYTFVFYFFAYIFLYTVSTMTMVPYSALCTEMSTDFKERNRLSGTRMIFSVLSTMAVALFAERIIRSMDDPGQGHLYMGLVFACLFALPWIFVFIGTWELPVKQTATVDGSGIFRNFGTIFRNRSFRVHIVMYIASYSTMDIVMAWLKFYLTDYLEKPALLSTGLAVLILSELAMLPLYIVLANKKGHGTALVTGLSIWGAAMILFAFHTPATSSFVIIANCFLIGTGLSAAVVMPWSMLPFVTDVDTLITGKHRAGTYAGAMTLIRKLIQGAFVLPLLGLLLTLIAYKTPNAEEIRTKAVILQSVGTLSAMKLCFIGMPLVMIALGIVASFFFRINKSTHAVIMDEMRRLDSGGKREDADPQVRSVCETLSGHPYEELYPVH